MAEELSPAKREREREKGGGTPAGEHFRILVNQTFWERCEVPLPQGGSCTLFLKERG